ncbi:hypothetical protein [Sinorhizobium mexicanum]|uniref:Uncharacterized protein n=1 Tax=Sinorhizobium mexicanum TaxID=375549 RepID=A0A859QR19_9HYPH|nr:hypothetical protein [Sinorhizobium mexicanum]MBP1884932.1 hypothetical protein [Sinorhizobium mexicanum]QLL64567.1 hypothetical protein FKV68_24530 [Sinorhizobium mexicanum]
MRQQTKPVIVEIKPSRKRKSTDRKTSIWGRLDLTPEQDILTEREQKELSAVGGTTTDPERCYAAALSSA